nr:AHH domain-containing protein [Clostridium sp. UBA4548]
MRVCFVAGTAIVTELGDKPIENIKVGDKVYSQNVDTGEKGYKEVKNVFVKETSTLVHLEVDGIKIDATEVHPYKNAAHHIVPWNDARALDARNILDGFCIDYNSATNGVFLPMEKNAYTGDVVQHIGNHSAEYIQTVTTRLQEVVDAGGSSADAVSALNKIREELPNGTLKLNK